MPRRNDPPPTKTIIVYRNGDAFFPGRKVVLNPRQVSTFDSVLTSLTRTIEAPFGAVRRLYTPRQGRKVQHLDGLKHGSIYVAAGNEPFKNLDRIVVSARWSRTNDESCTINVFTNGEILVPPARVRIPKYTLRSWENVLAMVTEKVHLRTGAVHRGSTCCIFDACINECPTGFLCLLWICQSIYSAILSPRVHYKSQLSFHILSTNKQNRLFNTKANIENAAQRNPLVSQSENCLGLSSHTPLTSHSRCV
uniref:Si:dkey-25g12.4 n=1 Tax=Sphaeramia orbicularis TaxID=375764 RepID=A0A673CMW4_9TELE